MNTISKWLSWRNLRTRIALALVGLTLALGIAALVQATLDLTTILQERLQNRGIAIARDLAARSTTPSQTNDIFALYEIVNDSKLNNEDVRYIFLVEPSGNVRVHTFEDGVPLALVDANVPDVGERQRVRLLRTNEGAILDIAVPVLQGRGGVLRVGMSEAQLRQQVTSYIGRLSLTVAAAVLGAMALAFVASSVVTRPLTRLAKAAQRVGSGELDTKVPVSAADEMGDLAQAFNAMTEDLRRSRESLIQRNTELEILNSMADTLSRHLGREQVLHASVERLLGLTGWPAAWVCAKSPQGRMALVAYRGVSPRVPPVPVTPPEAPCGCRGVFALGRPQVVPESLDCPLVCATGATGGLPRSCAAVPLWSQDSVAAVLCVASHQVAPFDETQLRLLTSLGQQMGIALQNSTLYEELQSKERMRAELLDKLIRIQEEERTRIARELHDEPAQELTGVLLQLDKVVRHIASTEERRLMEQARQGVRVAMESLYRITTELRPQALDDLGFVPAVRWYAQQRLGDQGVQVDFHVAGRPDRLPALIEVAVFRITQEAINNIAKHAQAHRIRIQLTFSESAIAGEIADNGRGFDPEKLPSGTALERSGLGLLGMQERAVLLGGSLSIASGPGRGTRITFHIPLAAVRFNHGREDQGPYSG